MEIFIISKGSVYNIMHEEGDIIPPIKHRGVKLLFLMKR